MHRIQQIRYEACSKKKKKKKRTRTTLPGNVARGEFTVTLRGVWKHSTVTAMADADQSRRDDGILAFPLLAGIEIFQNSHHQASL
jgi:hypothetical protein